MSKKNISKDSLLLKALGIFLIVGIGLFVLSLMLLDGYSYHQFINNLPIFFYPFFFGVLFLLLKALKIVADYVMIKSPFVLGKNSKFAFYQQIFIVLKGVNLNTPNCFDVAKKVNLVYQRMIVDALLLIKADSRTDDSALIEGVKISAPSRKTGLWKITAVIRLKSNNRTFNLLIHSQKDSDLMQNSDFQEWFEKKDMKLNKPSSSKFYSCNEVDIIVKHPESMEDGRVYDLSGNRVYKISKTMRDKSFKNKSYLGRKEFDSGTIRWVEINPDEIKSELNKSEFIIQHSLKDK